MIHNADGDDFGQHTAYTLMAKGVPVNSLHQAFIKARHYAEDELIDVYIGLSGNAESMQKSAVWLEDHQLAMDLLEFHRAALTERWPDAELVVEGKRASDWMRSWAAQCTPSVLKLVGNEQQVTE